MLLPIGCSGYSNGVQIALTQDDGVELSFSDTDGVTSGVDIPDVEQSCWRTGKTHILRTVTTKRAEAQTVNTSRAKAWNTNAALVLFMPRNRFAYVPQAEAFD